MKRYFIYILIALCLVCDLQAFNLIHKTGVYNELQDNGMQQVHTEIQIVYANPGDTLRLYRPERMAFTGYIRWYCYDTDSAAQGIIHDDYNVSAWNDKYTISNDRGLFKRREFVNGTNRQSKEGSEYYEVDYIMHSGDSIYKIAVDESIYWDYIPNNEDWRAKGTTTLTEPTLSKRIIYEMHPASEIASMVDTCTGDVFLEEHELIAPAGRQLYVGPNYRFRCKDEGQQIYRWKSHSNYYYNESSPIQMYEKSDWEWEIDGVPQPDFTMISSQYIEVSYTTPGTHTYKLKFDANGTYYNIAKFTITYIDTAIVGPAEILPTAIKKLDMIYESTFNYDEPGVTSMAFWNGHFDADESTYGCYYENLSTYRDHHSAEPNWCEYGIVNAQDIWVSSGTKPWIYNHVDGLKNLQENARKGYLIFVDGGQQPGEVFSLNVSTSLCPGSKMYFSAWLIDASPNGGGKCAPNMDFIVIGVDDNQEEHILTTFTTGEFGCNAKKVVGKNGNMENGKWYQIMFPIQLGASEIYQTYKLRITNKGKSADGNDFAIDDIRIYVEKPPVNPIQASTYDCPLGTMDSVTSYLRVDYQAIDKQENTFYYQWRDYNDSVIVMQYANGNNGVTSTYGRVVLPESEEAVIAAGDTCSSLLAFDAKYFNTEVPVVKYIKERIDPTTERYIMYIAQPMVVRTNYNYTGYVVVRPEDLGTESECGTKAELLIAGGTRITIDGEALGDSVVSLCGNRSYTLDIVLTYITQNLETGELEEHTTPCKADWLIGDSAYVNANPDVYKYTFDDIKKAAEDYRSDERTEQSVSIINYLLKHNLIVLDTTTTSMQPSVSSSYTAFPTPGSAKNGMSVCLTPRFLYINSDIATTNMVVIGDSTDTLPQAIADRPRVIRISNTQKSIGLFTFNTYIKGEGETYIVEKATLVSSTNTNWNELPKIELTATSTSAELSNVDSITIIGDGLTQLDAGYDYTFHVEFKDEDHGCQRGYTYFTLRIVPDEVIWYGKEWNKDENWDTFVPLNETNVILQPKDYNVTFSEDTIYDVNFQKNQCKNIYFPDGASLAGQGEININGIAFIDIKEYAWKWTLTSIPIQGVVSGDLFISTNERAEPFVVAPINQTVGSDANDRIVWQVYNREYDAAKDKWKNATNNLIRPIYPGEATMIGIDCETDEINPIIRLPKQDTIYHYFEKNQQKWLNEQEYVTRSLTYGKPAWNGDSIFALKEIYTNTYLFGNPTFGYVNITNLISDNSDKLTGKYYLEIAGAESAPRQINMSSFDKHIDSCDYDVLLPPYRGILLEGKNSSQVLIINVNETHINPEGHNAPKRHRNVENDIPTSIENVNINNATSIYDMMGRLYSGDLKNLQSGIYIIRSENKTYKIFLN